MAREGPPVAGFFAGRAREGIRCEDKASHEESHGEEICGETIDTQEGGVEEGVITPELSGRVRRAGSPRRTPRMRVVPALLVALACTRQTGSTSEHTSNAPASARHGAVTFEARSRLDADSRSGPLAVQTSVTYANTGTRATELNIAPGCLVSLRLRNVKDGREWDQVRWRSRLAKNSGFVLACTDTGATLRLPPGARATLHTRDAPSVAEILGDSLAEGEYLVTATVFAPAGPADAPPVDLAAGRVHLKNPR